MNKLLLTVMLMIVLVAIIEGARKSGPPRLESNLCDCTTVEEKARCKRRGTCKPRKQAKRRSRGKTLKQFAASRGKSLHEAMEDWMAMSKAERRKKPLTVQQLADKRGHTPEQAAEDWMKMPQMMREAAFKRLNRISDE